MTDDLRAALRARIAESLRSRTLLDGEPVRINDVGIDHFTDLAFDALKDGAEWLMTQAEQYQARAHTAEKALAVRPRNRWSASADIVVVVPCVFAAAGVAALVQWLTGSELAGNACAIASLAVTTPVGVRIERAWRRAAR